jgi:hypothetical protein
MERPDYFEHVRDTAARGWARRETDLEDTGVWRTLLEQVKDARHVVSELLQNADDAGARKAAVHVDGNTFAFDHDGVDFDPESFGSLCRFGRSNKRTLHTVGFRGIGFKSTFALGPRVEVRTPTLAVRFDEERFTEPVWLEGTDAAPYTRIEVPVTRGKKEVGASLKTWAASPAALLFLRHVEAFDVQGRSLNKQPVGSGPVRRSTRVRLSGRVTTDVLYGWSKDQPFPADARVEVRAIRRLPEEEHLPPCRVELVLGLPGEQRVFAVLPSDDRNALPFSFNAPFVQVPDRSRLKEDSATNDWLLGRVGRLAAETLLGWLANERLSLAERADAYRLLPKRSGYEWPAQAVAEAFWQALDGQPLLLGHDGRLYGRDECLDLSPELLRVWTPEESLALFGDGQQAALALEVGRATRERLRAVGLLAPFEPAAALRRLREKRSPRPSQPDGLLHLWAYAGKHQGLLKSNWTGSEHRHERDYLRVLTVRGSGSLYSAREVVLASGWRLAEEDRTLLEQHVRIADEAAWPDASPADEETAAVRADARQFGRGLRETLQTQRSLQAAVEQASRRVFSDDDPGPDGPTLARLLAHHDLKTPEGFKYKCRDGRWRLAGYGYSTGGWSREWHTRNLLAWVDAPHLLPGAWAQAHVLADDYAALREGEQGARWERWVRSERSRLHLFPVPEARINGLYSKGAVETLCRERGVLPPSEYKRQRKYDVKDHDFGEALWTHWSGLSGERPSVWAEVVSALASEWSGRLDGTTAAELRQWGNEQHYPLPLPEGKLPSAWVHRLRQQRCLRDEQGEPHRPDELYRRTFETAELGPFVEEAMDRPETVALLDVLGVRSKSDDTVGLVARIRVLAETPGPMDEELDRLKRLYRALGTALKQAPSQEVAEVRRAFSEGRLIRGEEGGWHTAAEVFREREEGFPAVPSDVRRLPLWENVGVGSRPDEAWAERALRALSVGRGLSGSQRRQVRAVLRRYPALAGEHGHWLSLAGRWTPLGGLRWRSSGALDLYPHVADQVADVSMVPGPIPEWLALLPALEEEVEWHASSVGDEPAEAPPWWRTFARVLAEAEGFTEDVGDAAGVCDMAARLREAAWIQAGEIARTPHLDGRPVGSATAVRAVYDLGRNRLVMSGKRTAYRDDLVRELGRIFGGGRVAEWIAACANADEGYVVEYLDERVTRRVSAPVSPGSPLPATEPPAEPLEETSRHDPRPPEPHAPGRPNAGGTQPVVPRPVSPPGAPATPPVSEQAEASHMAEAASAGPSEPADWEFELRDRNRQRRVERAALEAVIGAEPSANDVRDVGAQKLGYDVRSVAPDGRRRLIEVKGRTAGATTFYVTRNEIECALAHPDEWVLALVEVDGAGDVLTPRAPVYVRRPFISSPGPGVDGWTCRLDHFRALAEAAPE